MAIKKAPDYKTPACESAIGNKSVDIMKYTLAVGDALGDVIKLRRMSERNTYVSISVYPSAAMAAAATVDVGYSSREGGAGDDDAFGAALDVNGTLAHEGITGAPIPVPEMHDLTLTLNTDPAADVGKFYTIVAEFVNLSG